MPNGFFGKNLPVENEKSEHHYWILYIRISLVTKFQLKLIILIFLDQICSKRVFQSETEKVKTTIEFWIFELVYVPNLNVNWLFWFFGPNLPNKGISGLN